MRINIDELHYRIRTDNSFKRRLKKLALISSISAIFLVIIIIAGIVFFSSTITSFFFNNVPAVTELAFNYVRSYASSFMLEDLNAILNPLTGGTNVTEMKNLVTQYFDQLKSNPGIDFQSFQNFIATTKNSLLDSKITNNELEQVRQFLLN